MRFSFAFIAVSLLAACSLSVPAISLNTTSISPDHGPAGGGTVVTISGQGLTNTQAVAFGSATSSSVKIVSDTMITAVTPPGNGIVPVVVYDAHFGAAPLSFTYGPSPHLLSLTPSHGAAGSTVTLHGSGFAGATKIAFGAVAATSFTVESDTQLSAVVPPGTGSVSVTVTTPFGTTDAVGFAYDPAAPTLSSIAPSTGPTTGGTTVTLTGTNLGGATTVRFGSNAATQVQLLSATSVTAIAPAGTGTVDVTLTTPSGTSNALSYVYVDTAPTLTHVMPADGPFEGGNTVTLSGTWTGTVTGVSFGGVAATSFTIVGSMVQAVVPAWVSGATVVDVSLTTPDGTATLTGGYTYDSAVGAVTATSLSPAFGPTAGGTMVTITGTSFAPGDTTVTIGSTLIPAGSVTVTSSTSLHFTTPAEVAGNDAVVVTAGSSTSPVPGGYTYEDVPTATSLSPAFGPSTGGTSVTVTGANFVAGDTSVVIGGATIPPMGVIVISSTALTFTTPTHAAGNVAVTVSTSGGTTSAIPGGFTYTVAPTATSLSPAYSPVAGGTSVTITGTNFIAGNTTVTIGSTTIPAGSITVNSATSLTFTTPAEASGNVAVVVTTAGGTTSAIPGGFTYENPPTISATSVPAGPAGTSITITGSGFVAGDTTVTIGGILVPSSSVTVNTSSSLTFTAPAHAAGPASVTVTTSGGSATLTNGFNYI